MNRRQFIKGTIAVTGSLTAAAGGVFLVVDGTPQDELTITDALNRLELLASSELEALGDWSLFQVFSHCAQSVEYSMSQYPVHKSTAFKQTVGSLAFAIFAAKGRMQHSLSEPIPGAPELMRGDNVQGALARLRLSLIAFQQYSGEYAPHFAYGGLSKREYERAHVMHLNNHLQAIKIV